MFTAERYHDISTGHRVVGHENKCRHLHGHNYRIHFVCVPAEITTIDVMAVAVGAVDLDSIGRVIDFGVIKERLCQWLEDNWDHKTLLWEQDPLWRITYQASEVAIKDVPDTYLDTLDAMSDSFVLVPFNPTAENMARHLVEVVGPNQLRGTGVVLDSVHVEETRKCSASYTRAF